jgi:hypothetical protein
MFTREKYSKGNQSLNNSGISKNIISSNKYHQRNYQKTKKQMPKKNKCDRLWKKQLSYNHWNDKENDKNNVNYNYNKKFYYDNNKKKSFRYQKKISYSEFDFDSNISEVNNNKKNGKEKNYKEEEYDSKEEISKEEKNNSIEYTTTTAYSNSISAHEDSNNNAINANENLNINEFKLTTKDSSHSDNIKLYSFNLEHAQFFPKKKIIEENKQENININKEEFNDINNQYFSNSMKNLNFIRVNSCPNPINEFSSLSTSQIPKVQNKNIYQENNAAEPFNKYNTINQELNHIMINPIAENTEILNVNVKISKEKSALFKLRRFDDLFLTVKLFCEINSIDEKFMKPIIIKTLCALNNIYQVFNTQIDDNNIKRLKQMNTFINNTYI